MIRLEAKRSDERRTLRHDWTPFLGTDTIASQTTTSPDVTILASSIDTGNQSITFMVDGGTDGETATIMQAIVTAAGDHETETFTLPIVGVSEPVSVNEAKLQLSIVDDDSQDALIASYIRSARAYVESESGYVFVRRQFTESLNAWPSYLTIGRRPLISVDSIDYIDSDGTPQTLDEADYYIALSLRRVTPVSAFPTLGTGGEISVTYTAGFAEGEQVEELELARQAIFVLVGHWFANRETVVVGGIAAAEVPFAARALIDRFRAQVV